jgi:TRAP-type mannitol/chloroaromatic compound transport system substrate-binding protein
MKRNFLIPLMLSLSICILAWTTPAQSGSKVYKWKLQHDAPRGDIQTQLLIHFSKDVEKRSNGRLKIKIFADPEIVPGYELLQGVMAGVLEMSNTSGLFESGQIPLSAIEFGLPRMYKFPKLKGDFIKEANEIRDFFYKSGMVDLLRQEYAKFGVYWLDMHTFGPDALFLTKPVQTINDFKGMKMAVVPQYVSWIESMGAASTELVGGDLYMGLKLGVVDAGTWDINGIAALKFHEVAPNVLIGYSNDQMIGHFEVNMKAWNSLPDDLKQVLKDATKAWWDYKNDVILGIVQDSISMGEKGEFKLQQLDEKSYTKLDELSFEVWDEWAKRNEACRKAVALQKQWYKTR